MDHKSQLFKIFSAIALLSLILGIFPFHIVHASDPQIYYVNVSTGDDGNNGSSLLPWKTIAYAIGQVIEGDTIQINGADEVAPYLSSINVDKGITLVFAKGFVIRPDAGNCINISVSTSSTVRLIAAAIGDVKCDLESESSGILMSNGIQDLVIDGFEISGNHMGLIGIDLEGSVRNLQIVNNNIHDLKNHAVLLKVNPSSDVVNIQGNLFQNNGGFGIYSTQGGANFDVKYNSWGDLDGPEVGDIKILGFAEPASTYYTPWTYAAVSITSTSVKDSFLVGDQITYTVQMNAIEVMGVDIKLLYPPDKLGVVSAVKTGPPFDNDSILDTGVSGTISFHGLGGSNGSYQAVTANDVVLFTVTFTAIAPCDGPCNLNLDESSAAFAMAPESGPSTHIYPSALIDTTVMILAPSASVASTVWMQGRTDPSGIAVDLADGSSYGESHSTISTTALVNNVTFPDVVEDTYSITVARAGYLTASGSVTIAGDADNKASIPNVELKGGDVNGDQDIDVSDGTILGGEYGNSVTDERAVDINGDGKVDIFDLAIMGGNYGETSGEAYFSWLP